MIRLKPLASLLIGLLTISLTANGLLGWRWHTDILSYRKSIATRDQHVAALIAKNRVLRQQNLNFQTSIETKDKELAAKIKELTDKQKELANTQTQLTDLSKQLADKKTALASAEKQISDQKSQLNANASELSKLRDRPPLFSFKVSSSSLVDVDAKKAAVKDVVTAAYDVIESIYSKPYLLHGITISFVDNFTNPNASGETVITNSDQGLDIDIHIKDFDKNSFDDINTIIHELIHAYHGLAALNPSAFEEGITVAATDAVMKQMISSGTIPSFSPLYIRISDTTYADWQQSLSIPANDSSFYSNSRVADYYQLLGKVWYQLYQHDSSFFEKFNEKLYEQKHNGQEITGSMVLDIVRTVAPNADLAGAAWNLK